MNKPEFEVGQVIKPKENRFCQRAKILISARRMVEEINDQEAVCSVVVSGYADSMALGMPNIELELGGRTTIFRSNYSRWEVAHD